MRPPELPPKSRPSQMRRYRATRRPPSRLTRRELLLGGAGVCVALAAGAVVERGRIVGEVERLLTRSEHSLVPPHSGTRPSSTAPSTPACWARRWPTASPGRRAQGR